MGARGRAVGSFVFFFNSLFLLLDLELTTYVVEIDESKD